SRRSRPTWRSESTRTGLARAACARTEMTWRRAAALTRRAATMDASRGGEWGADGRRSKERGRMEMTGDRASGASPDAGPSDGIQILRLYIAGQTPKSIKAFANLKKICEEHLSGKYRIEVIDLVQNPQLAAGDQILAVPTLVRRLPEPVRRIIGDLSNTERVLVGLDVRLAR